MKTLAAYLSILFLLAGCSQGSSEPRDTIAKVGDQVITISQIDTLINSSAMVGMDLPAIGTSERNRARLTLLDRVISANLLYLDAKKRGLDKDAAYQRDMERFSKKVLADLYKEKILVGDVPVSRGEIRNYYKKNVKKGTKLTDDVKLAIEATIRKEKFKARVAGMRERLRKGVDVAIREEALKPKGDKGRNDAIVAATVGQERLTWGDVKEWIAPPSLNASLDERKKVLERIIDDRIKLAKALEAGLDKDPVYLARIQEFGKIRLVNIRRTQLLKQFAPDKKEMRTYYQKNRKKIVHPERRKVQMIVVKTREEAEKIRKQIMSGSITLYEAARDYSVDPNAKKTLGEMGWVSKGTGFPKLDKLTFSLKKEKLGGPVKSPAGWHLVNVLEIQDAQYVNLRNEHTGKRTRRMLMHEKLNAYVVNLRKKEFVVAVYDDVFNKVANKEMKRRKKLLKKAKKQEQNAPAKI